MRRSHDSGGSDRIDAGELALIVWSFAEMPRALALEHDGHLRKCARRALKALSLPVRRHATEFSADEMIAVVWAYETAYDDCWLGGQAARTSSTTAPTFNPPLPMAAAADDGGPPAGSFSPGLGSVSAAIFGAGSGRSAASSEASDASSGIRDALQAAAAATADLDLVDERAVANHVLQALVPGALMHPDAFKSDQLGEARVQLTRESEHRTNTKYTTNDTLSTEQGDFWVIYWTSVD